MKLDPKRIYRSKKRILKQIDTKCYLTKEEWAHFSGLMTRDEFIKKIKQIGIDPDKQQRIKSK